MAWLFRSWSDQAGRSGIATMNPLEASSPPQPAMFNRLREKPCATTTTGAFFKPCGR